MMKETNINFIVKGISNAFILGMMLTLIGCTEESVLDSQDIEYKYGSLTIRELTEFNNSLGGKTRTGISEELKNRLKIPLADSKGAYEGAKLGIRAAADLSDVSSTAGATAGGALIGATTSFDHYRLFFNSFNQSFEMETACDEAQSSTTSTSDDSGLPIESEVGDVYFDAAYAYSKNQIVENDYALGLSYRFITRDCIRIGILHNHILRYLSYVMRGIIVESFWNSLTSEEKLLLESNSFVEGRNRLRLSYGYPTVTYVSNSDKVMNLFIDAVLNGGNNNTEVDKIIKQYITTVSQSQDLTNDDKQALYSGFIVMAYSYQFWEPILNLNSYK